MAALVPPTISLALFHPRCMACQTCQSQSVEGFAPAGAFGTQCECTFVNTQTPASTASNSTSVHTVKKEDLEALQSVTTSLDKPASSSQQEVLGATVIKPVWWSKDGPEGSVTEPEDQDIPDSDSKFDFLGAPLADRNASWYERRLDVAVALDNEHACAQHREIVEDQRLAEMQVELERMRLRISVQRVLVKKQQLQREKLARVVREMRRRLTESRFHP
ncbi:hypothetical protein D9758_013979 [Tetrapyrgos nigripes]|uniref:Uncharacterized protein n=1 Tax=Tetrapyrgos nigripes TaxID=182062 RepID=A0A8H5LJZ9_9AGAR|nr:hypothetical protein D9758_013979 [Tetrapyrgos nigripes]